MILITATQPEISVMSRNLCLFSGQRCKNAVTTASSFYLLLRDEGKLDMWHSLRKAARDMIVTD